MSSQAVLDKLQELRDERKKEFEVAQLETIKQKEDEQRVEQQRKDELTKLKIQWEAEILLEFESIDSNEVVQNFSNTMNLTLYIESLEKKYRLHKYFIPSSQRENQFHNNLVDLLSYKGNTYSKTMYLLPSDDIFIKFQRQIGFYGKNSAVITINNGTPIRVVYTGKNIVENGKGYSKFGIIQLTSDEIFQCKKRFEEQIFKGDLIRAKFTELLQEKYKKFEAEKEKQFQEVDEKVKKFIKNTSAYSIFKEMISYHPDSYPSYVSYREPGYPSGEKYLAEETVIRITMDNFLKDLAQRKSNVMGYGGWATPSSIADAQRQTNEIDKWATKRKQDIEEAVIFYKFVHTDEFDEYRFKKRELSFSKLWAKLEGEIKNTL